MFPAMNPRSSSAKVDDVCQRNLQICLWDLAEPVARLVLEKNINESKHWNVSEENEAIIDRSPRQVQANLPVANAMAFATKKPSSWNAGHITSLATAGMQTVGAIANAFGSIFGKEFVTRFSNGRMSDLGKSATHPPPGV